MQIRGLEFGVSEKRISGGGGGEVVVLQAATQRFPLTTILFMVALYVAIYLLFFRPQQAQQRKRREMLSKLKKGDRVVTIGGLHAVVLDVDGEQLSLELAPNLRVKADRGAVSYLRNKKQQEPTPISATPPPT